jgi:hypothetical protein
MLATVALSIRGGERDYALNNVSCTPVAPLRNTNDTVARRTRTPTSKLSHRESATPRQYRPPTIPIVSLVPILQLPGTTETPILPNTEMHLLSSQFSPTNKTKMSTFFKLASFCVLLLATLSRVAAAQQHPVEKAVEVFVICDDMRATSSWNQRKRASSTSLEQAIATVAVSASPSLFAPVSNVTFVATLRAPLSWGVNVEGPGWMTSSAVFHGTQLVNTSDAYPTEALKAQYPAIGRNFTTNLKALRVALFAYVKNCRIERMSLAV